MMTAVVLLEIYLTYLTELENLVAGCHFQPNSVQKIIETIYINIGILNRKSISKLLLL